MTRYFALCLSILLLALSAAANTLHVGNNQPYPSLSAAVLVVQPGDTIEIHAGTYSGGLFFSNLKGSTDQWITIRGAANALVVFQGGNNAMQLSDPAFLHFQNLIFQEQTGNGFNTDDGGSYNTPAHHILFENCTFRNMAVSGNNDLLKLSGLNDFEIRHCTFLNGAAGGSGIDMVGCHQGIISGCHFENMGSNAIQAKGGTEYIRIEGNFFKNCGQRSLNLGGSTGLAFFRPDTAHFEAANLQVYSNVIIGSVAAVAYVGALNVEVINNTIYLPEKWVLRILQETVDPDRFLECGDNSFRNNIVVRNSGLSTETNIGPNTRPETFFFANNLWFHNSNSSWNGPNIPVAEMNGIINQNPLLADPDNADFHIPMNSPAVGAGQVVSEPVLDFYGMPFSLPRSIGAAEGILVSGTVETEKDTVFDVYPNPFSTQLSFRLPSEIGREHWQLQVYNAFGQRIAAGKPGIPLSGYTEWPTGSYFFVLGNIDTKKAYQKQVIKVE